MPFLTARWSNLCLFTYAVPDALLTPRLPPGIELDRLDGRCFVSLVAFDFLDTRVLGVPWPGYRNFAEVNLRFYVRRGSGPDAERGVCFIREFVPQRLVAWMARTIYNEPYVAAPLTSAVRQTGDAIDVEHRLTFGGRVNTIRMAGTGPAACPAADSTEHFFKEHRWGYGTTRGGRLLRYEVVHPHWDCYRVTETRVDLDWAAVYGAAWTFLKDAEPFSTVLAAGSAISVSPKSLRLP